MIDEDLPDIELSHDGPSEDTSKAIREAVMAELEPVQAMSVTQRALYGLAAAVATAALVVVSYGGMGIAGITQNAVATAAVTVVALLTALAIGAAFSERGQQLGGDSRKVIVAAIVVAWSVYLFSQMTSQALHTALAGPAIGCAARSLFAGALGGGAFMWIWRKTDPWNPSVSGALLGGCAGIIASASVGIPCAAEVGGHLLTGHWMAVPILAIAGAAVARRTLQP